MEAESAVDVGQTYIRFSLIKEEKKSIFRTFEFDVQSKAKGHGKVPSAMQNW